MSRCVCTSMPPGKTYLPAASIILPAFSRGRVCPMASILPFVIAISPVNVSVAVTTRPFAMMVSNPMTRSLPGRRKSNFMLNCRTSDVVSAGVHSFASIWYERRARRQGEIRFYNQARHASGAHRRAHAPGGGRWIRLRLGFRFACALAGALSPTHSDGHEHDAHAPRHLCDQSGGARSDRYREPGRHAESDFAWADAVGHRSR